MAGQKMNSVLFICLGNICRSPTAEVIFRSEVEKRRITEQWLIDSAALIPFNIGKSPDSRAMKCLQKRGLNTHHRARLITKEDFNKFDMIIGMDHDNMAELTRLKPENCKAKLKLLGDFHPVKPCIIHDPYGGSDEDFETVFEQCSICCQSLLDKWLALT